MSIVGLHSFKCHFLGFKMTQRLGPTFSFDTARAGLTTRRTRAANFWDGNKSLVKIF